MKAADDETSSRSRHLCVLMVDDSPAEAAVLKSHFAASGYSATIDCVNSLIAMRAALASRNYHVVIVADNGTSELGALQALNVLRQSGCDIPLIIISDAISDEMVVAAMRAGAHDYVLKSNLARLLPAIEKGRQQVRDHQQKRMAEVARQHAEEALRISEARLQGIINSALDAIISLDAQHRIIIFTAAAERIFGCKAVDALGSTLDRFISSRQQQDHDKHIFDFGTADVTTRSMASPGTLSALRADGKQFPIEATISQVDVGKEKLLTVSLRDVSERRDTVEALRQSEQELRAIYRHVAVGIEHTSLDGHLQMVNPAFQNLLGYSESELLGKPFEEITHPDDHQRERLLLKSLLNGECDSYAIEKRYLHRDGSSRWVSVTSSLVKDAHNVPFSRATIVQDIAERKRAELLEDKLRQAERLESLGQLAGAVAHDFNTLLSVMLGYAELLFEELPEGDPRRSRVKQIEASAKSGAQLTGQLLAFSRKQPVLPQVVDLKKVVADMKPMLLRLLPADIQVTIQCPEEVCPVKVDHGRIQQIVLNLATNARDAMHQGGTLAIEVRTVDLDDEYVRRHVPMVAGRYELLAVSDTGSGMNSETLAHLYEPFFTTKESGKGTGLGLSTVYGIVKQCGGEIWVDSKPGVGSIFKVYLPHACEPVENFEAAPPPPKKLGGNETILLAEDSSPLRHLARELLLQQGYTVLEAADGVEALELSSTHVGEIHLLLTDIVMPRMRGTELASHFAEQHPHSGIVFLTGYAEEIMCHMKSSSKVLIVQKPYTVNALLQSVRQTLDARQNKEVA